MPCGWYALRIFGSIDFISRKTPKILILSAKLNILKKDVADGSMNVKSANTEQSASQIERADQ